MSGVTPAYLISPMRMRISRRMSPRNGFGCKRRLPCAHTDHRFSAALHQPNCWILLPPCDGMAHLIKSDAETKNFKEDDITMLSECPADFVAHFEKAQEVSS